MISYILVIVLIALSAFFSSSETAISSANRIRLKHKASEGDRRAERALSVMDSFDRALSAILIGNNVVNIAASSLATVICISLVGNAYGPVLSTARCCPKATPRKTPTAWRCGYRVSSRC